MDYKNTLNLPQTDFPMKADLVTREPERLKKWEAAGLYAAIQAQRAGAEKFVLHDGPPFANGDVHIGTAAEQDSQGHHRQVQDACAASARPTCPGWDCHGLPIEFKVTQDMRKAGDTASDAATIRKACEAYARKYIDIQRAQFKRLGVLGRLGEPLPDAGQGIRGRRAAAVCRHRGAGICLSRQEAGLLEHPLPHGAGRGRGRIQGPRQPERVCEVPAGGASRTRRS